MDKEVLKNSILLIGPMGVGKSMIGDMLSYVSNIELICQDNLGDYVADYFNENVYSTGIIGMLIQDLHYKWQSNKVMKGAKLTKEQKRARKSYLHSLYKEQNYYNKLSGGFENLMYRTKKYLKSSDITEVYSYDMKLINEQDFLIDISSPLLNNIKNPIIFDASGLCFMDQTQNLKDLADEGCSCYNEEKIKEVIDKVKKTAGLFGTVVFFEPTDYYYNSLSDEMKNTGLSKLMVMHLEDYKRLSNCVVRPKDLFFDCQNEAFSTRNPLDFIKADQRRKLINKKEATRLCCEILSARDEILSEQNNSQD